FSPKDVPPVPTRRSSDLQLNHTFARLRTKCGLIAAHFYRLFSVLKLLAGKSVHLMDQAQKWVHQKYTNRHLATTQQLTLLFDDCLLNRYELFSSDQIQRP